MAVISVTNINDGDAVTAASVNNQVNTIVNDYNGNVTDANISASAAIGAQKIAGGVSGMFGAWISWTPSYANITVGNGTVVSKYIQLGKTVRFKYKLTFGSTTSISGTPTVSFPVTATADLDVNTGVVGVGQVLDSSAASSSYVMLPIWVSTTTFKPVGYDTSNVKFDFSASSPFTWAVGDILYMAGEYEAA